MAIFELQSRLLKKIEETTFEAEGIKERRDLQSLLREQIEVVIKDVLIVAEEFGDWEDSRRRIDLLGLDKDANLVVIELKRKEDEVHELQAIRYAAMISTMTFEKLIEKYSEFPQKNGNGDRDARAQIVAHLGGSEPDEEHFAQQVRIILVSAEFSKELTTSVMWLNDRDLDITCVRMKPYKLDDRLLVDVQQVIPLPEAEEYQVRIREKEQEERRSRARKPSDPPIWLTWSDSPEQHDEIHGWVDLLERATARAIKDGLRKEDLPMKHGDTKEGLIQLREISSEFFVESKAGGVQILKWVSKMLNVLDKHKGFLTVKTESGRTILLPEDRESA
jgi:hypothetical protein